MYRLTNSLSQSSNEAMASKPLQIEGAAKQPSRKTKLWGEELPNLRNGIIDRQYWNLMARKKGFTEKYGKTIISEAHPSVKEEIKSIITAIRLA